MILICWIISHVFRVICSGLLFICHKCILLIISRLHVDIRNLLICCHCLVSINIFMRFSFLLKNELILDTCFFIYHFLIFLFLITAIVSQLIDFYQKAAILTFLSVTQRSKLDFADFVLYEWLVHMTLLRIKILLFAPIIHVTSELDSILLWVFLFTVKVSLLHIDVQWSIDQFPQDS